MGKMEDFANAAVQLKTKKKLIELRPFTHP